MTPQVDRVNRVLLIVIGLVLLVVGIGALLVSGGVFGDARADAPIVSSVVTDNVNAASPWLWPVLAAVALLVAVLAGWWAFSQPRSRPVSQVRLERTPAGHVEVAGAALAECVQLDCEAIPGVVRARARVGTEGEHTQVHLTAWVGAPYDLSTVVTKIDNSVLPHLAFSLDGPDPHPIRTTVHLEATAAALTRLR